MNVEIKEKIIRESVSKREKKRCKKILNFNVVLRSSTQTLHSKSEVKFALLCFIKYLYLKKQSSNWISI